MGTTPNHEIIRTLEDAGAGKLEVYTAYVDGVEVSKAFTLSSLAFVLDVPLPTIEGRYARARLKLWKVDIPSRAGRPMRGFPYSKLQDVLTIMRTPRAVVQHDPNTDAIIPMRGNGAYPLVVTTHAGEDYYTVAALADHFGMSPTTIRKKLSNAGLAGHAVNLGSTVQGGRPTRGYPASMRGQLKLAIEEGVPFRNSVDRMLVDAGAIEHARSVMDQASVSRPPASLDRSTTQPYTGANVVPLRRTAEDVQTDDLMAQIDGIMAKGVMPRMEELAAPRSEEAEFMIDEGYFHDRMAYLRNDHLQSTSVPQIEDIVPDIQMLVGHAEKAELYHLTMTPNQVSAVAQAWIQEWKHKRRDREPALEMMREMFKAHFAGRTERPAVEEILAANTMYANQQATKTEREELRALIAGPHHMVQMLKRVNMADVWETRAYQRHLMAFETMWAEKEAELAAQRRMAYKAKMALIDQHVEPPSDEVYAQAQAQLVAAGVHEVFAEIEMENARGYFDAIDTRSAA